MRRISYALAVAALVTEATFSPASAQLEVFDPTNYGQNIMTAANTLEQINNQIRSLQNEATSLVNEARNLTSLPYSSLSQLQSELDATRALVGQAQGVALDVQQIQGAFSGRYGKVGAGESDDALVADAQQRWEDSVGAFEDAMKVQATVTGNLPGTAGTMSQLVDASQSATGALQATQAGNQLLALQSQQLSDITTLLAAQGRAQSLDAARQAADESEAREQFRRFASPGPYSPRGVTMYGQ